MCEVLMSNFQGKILLVSRVVDEIGSELTSGVSLSGERRVICQVEQNSVITSSNDPGQSSSLCNTEEVYVLSRTCCIAS